MSLIYLIFTTIAIQFSVAVTSYGTCDTPLDELGECIPLEECNHLKIIAAKLNATSLQLDYLRQSQCGYLNQKVLICCPSHFTTERQWMSVGTRSRLSKLPEPPNCGQNIGLRIFGGTETKPNEYPWTALLIYMKPGNVLSHHCGGSLINNRYVLTAAHCIHAQDPTWRLTSVRLGEWDTVTDPDCIPLPNKKMACVDRHLDVPIAEILTHPQYKQRLRSQHNDIALLRLEYEIKFGSTIQPICLPIHQEQRSRNLLNKTTDVVGWGFTEELVRSTKKRRAELTVRDKSECRQKYIERNIDLIDSQLCAGGEAGIDSCGGDSGGPLSYLEVNEGMESNLLVGIVSLGPKDCGQQGWPGVYTRVDHFMDWILDSIRD